MRFAKILLRLLPVLLLCVLSLYAQRAWELSNPGTPFPHAFWTKEGGALAYPADWTTEEGNRHIKVASPQKDAFVYVLSSSKDRSPEVFGQICWKIVHPDFDLCPWQATELKKDDVRAHGCDKATLLTYPPLLYDLPSPQAVVKFFKDNVYVVLVEGTSEGFLKQESELAKIIGSWGPQGTQKITPEPKEPKNWDLYSRLFIKELVNDYKQVLKSLRMTFHRPIRWGPEQSQEFEKFILESMEAFKIPGAAIKIIRKDGNPIYEKAFGVKSIDSKEPLTLDTPFRIGSLTQPLTSLLMAIGVDQKKFSWETPIVNLLPEFSLADVNFTKNLTLRESMSASTTFLGERNFLGSDAEGTLKRMLLKYKGPQERLLEMQALKPSVARGTTIQFSDNLIMAGACATARALIPEQTLEEAYATALHRYVLDPLGMKHTALKEEDALSLGAAVPHIAALDGEPCKAPAAFDAVSSTSTPARTCWSSAEDIARYLLLELNGGTFNGKRVVSKKMLLERRHPSIKKSSTDSCDLGLESDTVSYGLGLEIREAEGLTIVSKNGGGWGFQSKWFFCPEKGVGFVALTNVMPSTNFLEIVEKKFLELAFGWKPVTEYQRTFRLQANASQVRSSEANASLEPKDTEWMESFVGEFFNDKLGSAKFSKSPDAKGYTLAFENFESRVGTRVTRNGTKDLCLVDSPLHFILSVGEEGNALVLHYAFGDYEFIRLKKPD